MIGLLILVGVVPLVLCICVAFDQTVGTGAQTKRLERLSARYPRPVFGGHASQQQVKEYRQQADIRFWESLSDQPHAYKGGR
jgi:hypothetical protein